MSEQGLADYGRRAEHALALAQSAHDEDARRTHYLEAARYLDLYYRPSRGEGDACAA